MLPDLSLKARLANQQRRKRHRSTSVSALDVGSPGIAAPPHPGDLIPCDDAISAKPAVLANAFMVDQDSSGFGKKNCDQHRDRDQRRIQSLPRTDRLSTRSER